jgi:lysophospholipase L1-like esterase
LTTAGIDLKYDYLRELVQRADLDPDDTIGMFDAKLARFRLPTIRWALSEMAAHARGQGKRMLVLLVPDGKPPQALAEDFLGIREILAELAIPYVDLSDTFAGVPDLEALVVSPDDRHPNAAGHELLFKTLYERMKADPVAHELVLGRKP